QRACPRILKKCRRDSDCPGECICKENGYCG
uniref:Trypsin inhibitor 3 n=1 Tax=Momordica cochinchinensis TaxID=3674 RepID=ITR3_MOMCO|nr:RecName: Full=Trypsin inhibitor 3; AltName: Full=MCoTI-III; AltName: Full=Trypsin inhibitor III [Momordica cochinchinensis]